jgi:hypothetical protein
MLGKSLLESKLIAPRSGTLFKVIFRAKDFLKTPSILTALLAETLLSRWSRRSLASCLVMSVREVYFSFCLPRTLFMSARNRSTRCPISVAALGVSDL